MKYYYDLHIHSALSPCADDDMTPNNIVNMAVLNGLDIIAVSDHNTCKNLHPVSKLAQKNGLVFVAGVELETSEEIHVLCLFSTVEKAQAFEDEIIAPALAPIKNNEKIFGKQQILNENDEQIGIDERFLINATAISIEQIYSLMQNYDGVAIPAHVDKATKSLVSVLGMTDPSLGFKTFELSKNAPQNFANTQLSFKGMDYNYIYNSDAHYLVDIYENNAKNYFELQNKPTSETIIKILRG